MTAFTVDRPRNAVEGIHVVENFISNDLVADNTLGQLGWELQTIANASTIAYLTPTAGDRPGGIRLTTAGTADGDGEALQTMDDTIIFPGARGAGGFAFAFRYPDITGNQLAGNDFRIGVETSLTATAPTDGLLVFSDAGVLNLRSDSADHGDATAAVAGVTTLTSGTTAVLGTIHLVEVSWSGTNGQGGPNLVEMVVDGQKAASLYSVIDDDETAELKIVHYQNSGGAATLELDLFFFEYWQFYGFPVAAAL